MGIALDVNRLKKVAFSLCAILATPTIPRAEPSVMARGD
jgi:hypothetical protein